MREIPNTDPHPNEDRIIRQPALWYARYMASRHIPLGYRDGLIALGLELESQARIFEALEGTSLQSLNKEEIATALRTLLRSLEIDDQVRVTYDKVIEFVDKNRTSFAAYDGNGNYLGEFNSTSGTVKEPQPEPS